MANPTKENLNAFPIIAFLTTSDSAKAKTFYGEKLGLKFVTEDEFAVVFKGHGTTLRINIMKKVKPLPYTVLGWEVPDIRKAVQILKKAGIEPEVFPSLKQDKFAVWKAPGGAAKVAWFKDPEGHILSVSQH